MPIRRLPDVERRASVASAVLRDRADVPNSDYADCLNRNRSMRPPPPPTTVTTLPAKATVNVGLKMLGSRPRSNWSRPVPEIPLTAELIVPFGLYDEIVEPVFLTAVSRKPPEPSGEMTVDGATSCPFTKPPDTSSVPLVNRCRNTLPATNDMPFIGAKTMDPSLSTVIASKEEMADGRVITPAVPKVASRAPLLVSFTTVEVETKE